MSWVGGAVPRGGRAVLPLSLTLVSGMLDAVSYLGLGHVFVANMTGNVVVLGMALGGSPDFSTPGCLVALTGFVGGTVVSGRLARAVPRWPLPALVVESALLVTATVVAFAGLTSAWRFVVICVLGLAMGLRTASIRLAGVSDITTTVITSTLAVLGAHSALAGGDGAGWERRLGAVLLLLAGAAGGAWLILRWGPGVALAVAVGIQVVAGGAYAYLARRRS
ncbi:YoaK family protein [Nonomuraea sp. NPDC050691]|uniref:YoaK family protein n=1 Tax=Nonomuraea sp. NPDC050691 TaxID=3155661 RepID=UPI003403F9E6